MHEIAIITGKIIHGKGLGRTVGMPTANLSPVRGSEIPHEGVYASIVNLRDGSFIGVTNIGRRPTVDHEKRVTIETNIASFDKDIYGETMILDIMYRLRSTRKMNSLEEDRNQVRKDMQKALSLLSDRV